MLRKRKKFDNPLQQYWHVLRKRQLTVALCFLGALGGSALYNASVEPSYYASAKILIEDTTKWLGVQDGSRLSMDWYTTQFEILRSRPIITRVVQKLDLTNQYWSHPSPFDTLRAKLLGKTAERRYAGPDPDELIPLVQRSVTINPQTSTGLVSVAVVGPDPALTRDITNALVETFIEENIKARMELSFSANEYLTKQLEKVSDRIREAQQSLEDFEQAEGIQGFGGDLRLDTQQFTEFVNRYFETRSKRWEIEQQLKVLKRMVETNDLTGINNPILDGSTVREASKAVFEAQLQLDKLRQRGLLEKHPEVVAALEEMATLRKRLLFESQSSLAGLEAELLITQEREQSLWETISKSRGDVMGASKKRAQYEYLKRDLDIQRGFFQSYDQQLKTLQLHDEIKPGSVRIVERATAPASPFAPNKAYNLGVGIFAGLFLGVFLAFFREYLDDTIKSDEDAQEYLEVPVLGTIPVIVNSNERGGVIISRKVDTASLVVEAYRTLRTNLQFFESERPLQVILVTSGGPAEGKSTTVANLGLTLVQMGKRVCLIDTDMRKPILHKIFNKPNASGLTSIYAGETDKRRLLVPCGFENLFLLPCGPIPPNPAELLASQRTEEAIRSLRKEFDYLILDSPPVLAVTDALIISSVVDGVLFVIKSGEARIGSCQMALDSLTSIKANVIGAVLNHFNYRQSGYYRHYSKYYRYGYAYGGKERTKSRSDAATQESPTRKDA